MVETPLLGVKVTGGLEEQMPARRRGQGRWSARAVVWAGGGGQEGLTAKKVDERAWAGRDDGMFPAFEQPGGATDLKD